MSLDKKWMLKQHILLFKSEFNCLINIKEEKDGRIIVVYYSIISNHISNHDSVQDLIISFDDEYNRFGISDIKWKSTDEFIEDNSQEYFMEKKYDKFN